jgi:hypothetical protein
MPFRVEYLRIGPVSFIHVDGIEIDQHQTCLYVN